MLFKNRASSGKQIRKRRSAQSLNYQTLEAKRMLASFSGTSDVDVVEIFFSEGQPTSITINGVPSANSDATLSLMLPENTEADSKDEITLTGDTFAIEIDQLGRQTMVNVNLEAVTIAADSGLVFQTGEGDDSVSIHHESDGSGSSFFDYGRPIDLLLGGGNDRVDYGYTPFGQWDLGGGDDLVVGLNGQGQMSGVSVDMGEGFDRWRVGQGAAPSIRILGEGAGGPRVGQPAEPFVNGYSIGELEWVVSVSSERGTLYGNENAYRQSVGGREVSTWRLDVSGETAWFTDAPTGHSLGFFNFDRFRGDFTSFGADSPQNSGVISVRAASYYLSIADFNRVALGGAPFSGDTSGLLGEISISNSFQTSISNASSAAAQEVVVDRISATDSGSLSVSGLTPQPVMIDRGLGNQQLMVFGSQTAADSFVINSVPRNNRFSAYGLGGDDRFRVGSSNGVSGVADLDQIKGVVNILDGDGDDFMLVDDSDNDLPFNYRLRDKWVHHGPTGGLRRDFIGIWFDSVEKVRVNGSEANNRFRVTPSLVTSWTIDGKTPTVEGPGWDWVDLLRGPQVLSTLIDNGDGTSSYYFGDDDPDDEDEKLIYVLNVESHRNILQDR